MDKPLGQDEASASVLRGFASDHCPPGKVYRVHGGNDSMEDAASVHHAFPLGIAMHQQDGLFRIGLQGVFNQAGKIFQKFRGIGFEVEKEMSPGPAKMAGKY